MDEHAHAIIKCDQCIERLQQGQLPACVVACPTGALEFKSMDDVLDAKRKVTLLDLKCMISGESK
jgi:formate dehydrogenase iron-sulfur subunit